MVPARSPLVLVRGAYPPPREHFRPGARRRARGARRDTRRSERAALPNETPRRPAARVGRPDDRRLPNRCKRLEVDGHGHIERGCGGVGFSPANYTPVAKSACTGVLTGAHADRSTAPSRGPNAAQALQHPAAVVETQTARRHLERLLKTTHVGMRTGVSEQAARGAITDPWSVGHALRRLSGHEPGWPKNPSRLAPQHEIPSRLLKQVNRSLARKTIIASEKSGPCRRRGYGARCRSRARRSTRERQRDRRKEHLRDWHQYRSLHVFSLSPRPRSRAK